jgi:folate-binding protein YgfZ
VANFYSKLLKRGALTIRGPDSKGFLQGQTTCDLDDLSPTKSLNGAYCTPQGRMVCDFRIRALNKEDCLLTMHRGLCTEAATTFGKYIVFSKAELSDTEEDWHHFAAWGEEAAERLGLGGGEENSAWNRDGVLWVQCDAAGNRFEAAAPAASAESLARKLEQDFETAPEENWELQEIDAGLGHVTPETSGDLLPQMLNYQATNRISFSKGCYTGQEVVARLHYRGKLKNPMYRARVSSGDCMPGTALFRQDQAQSIGIVVNAAPAAEGCHLLAAVRSDALEAGVHLGGTDGPLLEFLELPYSLESSSSG